jgi:hypothetical protein
MCLCVLNEETIQNACNRNVMLDMALLELWLSLGFLSIDEY